MPSLAVKVYKNGEIRRFQVDIGDEQRFGYNRLLNHVRHLYPDLDMNKTRLMWKDDDGEFISMSSNAELMEAVRHLPTESPILRIHLVDSENANLEQQNQQQTEDEEREKEEDNDPTMHRWVFCDGCQGTIRGIRFKCLTCPDFDLCTGCMEKSPHDEHPMIRIASPQDKSWKVAFKATQRKMLFPSGRCPVHVFVPEPMRPHPPTGPMQHHPTAGPMPPHPNGTMPPGPMPPQPPMFHTMHHPPTGTMPPGPPGMAPPQPPMFHAAPWMCGHPFYHGKRGHPDWKKCHDRKHKKDKKCGKHGHDHDKDDQFGEVVDDIIRHLGEAMENVMNVIDVPITVEDTSVPTRDNNQEPASASAPTTATQAEQPTAHPDPKIAAALNYMLAMGYKNEGGWLTRLIEEKRGDISAVLDILHPSGSH